MLWRVLFLILWLAAPVAADEIPSSGAQTDRLLYQLDGLSQALDHLESFRSAFPDPVVADAYLAAWRDMIEANALLYASRDSLPGPAYANYDQIQRPMVARIREATEILQNGWPAPTPPPEFEDLSPREQAALIARQAATNRGPDNRLLEIGRAIAANSPALEGLRSFDRACPASSEDIPVVTVQLSELEQLFRTVSEARAQIQALYDAAAGERDQQSRAFYEALAQSGAEEGGLLWHIDMPEDPNRFGEELYPGERLFVPIYRALYNAGFYGLLSITSHVARAQATRSLLGPVSIATSIWNTGSEIQSYQTVRIQMGAALGWVEVAAYLRQLRDRYEELEAELTRIRTDFRTLHQTACACRFE